MGWWVGVECLLSGAVAPHVFTFVTTKLRHALPLHCCPILLPLCPSLTSLQPSPLPLPRSLRWVFRCFPALSRPRIRAGHFLSRTHLLLLIAFPDLPPAPSLPRLAPAASESCQCAVSVYALPDARVEMASFLPTKELMAKVRGRRGGCTVGAMPRCLGCMWEVMEQGGAPGIGVGRCGVWPCHVLD